MAGHLLLHMTKPLSPQRPYTTQGKAEVFKKSSNLKQICHVDLVLKKCLNTYLARKGPRPSAAASRVQRLQGRRTTADVGQLLVEVDLHVTQLAGHLSLEAEKERPNQAGTGWSFHREQKLQFLLLVGTYDDS